MCCCTHTGEPCTFYVHTMKHQAAMNSEVCQVEIHSTPNRITVDKVMMKVMEKLKLPIDVAEKCFSLWLASPQLRTLCINLTTVCTARCIYIHTCVYWVIKFHYSFLKP